MRFRLCVFMLMLGVCGAQQNSQWQDYYTTSAPVNDLEINSNILWALTTNSLVILDTQSGEIATYDSTNSPLPAENYWPIECDDEGNAWISTNADGLLKYDGQAWTVYDTTNSGIPTNTIICVTPDSTGNIWVGTVDGLAVYDGTTWTILDTSNSELERNDIWWIGIDGNGNGWLASLFLDGHLPGDGLTMYSILSIYNGDSVIVNEELNTALENNNGNMIGGFVWDGATDEMWICFKHFGLVRISGNTWTLEFADDTGPERQFTCMVRDHSGAFWLGTAYNGLIRLDSLGWVSYTTSNSDLTNDVIKSLAVDDDNNIWIGTSTGITVYNEAGVMVGIKNDERGVWPERAELLPASPNPFNPNTNMSYSLHEQSEVSLTIYDVTGREVTILQNREQLAGSYELQWTGTDDSGNPVSTGVYFARLQAGPYSQTIKMLYLK